MIAEIVITMTLVWFLSLWQSRSRYNLVTTAFFTAITAILFVLFLNSWIKGQTESFFVLWDTSLSGDIRLNINSSLRHYRIVFPFFAITLFSLINNLTFKYETQKKNLSAFIGLNFVALIMLITAANFIQLITFVFVIDILSQLFIQDINAGRRYAVYNLVADMGLFLAFALLRGGLENLTISRLASADIPHRNFAVLIILLSLFIKLGFFIFHTCFLDLKSARFHRLVMVCYLSSPAAALILFVKLFPLLSEFTLFLPIVNIAVLLTLLWGVIGAIIINNLKEKLVYFNMIFISLMVKLAASPDFIWNTEFSLILITGFLFNICFYYLHYYISRKNNLIQTSETRPCNPLPFRAVSLLLIITTGALCMLLGAYYNPDSRLWIAGYSGSVLLAASHALNQIYRFIKPHFLKIKYDKTPLFDLLCVLAALLLIYYHEIAYWRFALVSLAVFAVLLLSFPLRFFAGNDLFCRRLQYIDFFPRFYNSIFIRPIKSTGEMLTLFVDFMFFEKKLIMFGNWLSETTIRTFRKISRLSTICRLFFVALSLLVFAWFIVGRNG